MTDLEILREMIKPSARVEIVEDYGRKTARLFESQYSDSTVKIFGLPDDAIVIKVDAFLSPDAVFAGSRGECKRADFVIIAEVREKPIVIYIEMKAAKGREREIVQQLAGAQCFLAYCCEIGKTFWDQPAFLNGRIERFVSIGHTSINKTRTRVTRQSAVHDRPEQMLKLASPHHVEFNHLAGVNR